MILTRTTNVEEEHEGLFTSAEAMKLQAKLEEGRPVRAGMGQRDDGMLPEWIGSPVPEGAVVTPILEVFHEHGDPEGIWTIRLYSTAMTERGAGRLFDSLCTALDGFKEQKRKDRKGIAKLGPKMWKRAPARPKDTPMLLAWGVVNEETGACNLPLVPFNFFPAWKPKETEGVKTAAWQALAQMVTLSQAQQGGSH